MRNKLRPKEIAKRRLLWEIAVGKKSEIPLSVAQWWVKENGQRRAGHFELSIHSEQTNVCVEVKLLRIAALCTQKTPN